MQAKFDSGCKKCDRTWKEEDPIFYQKEPKAVCSDLDCFKEQGGKIFDTPYNANKTQAKTFRPFRSAEEKQKDVLTFLAIPEVAKLYQKVRNVDDTTHQLEYESAHQLLGLLADIYNCR